MIGLRAVEAVICGGAKLLERRIETAGDLLAAYRDYRGLTAAGSAAAEDVGFPRAVGLAFEAATATARRP